jgi:hypothetical protein
MTILLSVITTAGLMLLLKYTIGLTVEHAEKGVDFITHGQKRNVSELDKARIFSEMAEVSTANVSLSKLDGEEKEEKTADQQM